MGQGEHSGSPSWARREISRHVENVDGAVGGANRGGGCDRRLPVEAVCDCPDVRLTNDQDSCVHAEFQRHDAFGLPGGYRKKWSDRGSYEQAVTLHTSTLSSPGFEATDSVLMVESPRTV